MGKQEQPEEFKLDIEDGVIESQQLCDSVWSIANELEMEIGRLGSILETMNFTIYDSDFSNLNDLLPEVAIDVLKRINATNKKLYEFEHQRKNAISKPDFQNDIKIIEAIETQRKLWASFDANNDDPNKKFWKQIKAAEKVLADTCSDTISGLQAKAEWLTWDQNFNGGDLTADSPNGKVLLSLFADIEKLGEMPRQGKLAA